MIAFWSYDQYPYLLSGTVTKYLRDDLVETKEYGVGAAFKVKFILPDESGKALVGELCKLKTAYFKAKQELHQEYKGKLDDLLKGRYDRIGRNSGVI